MTDKLNLSKWLAPFLPKNTNSTPALSDDSVIDITDTNGDRFHIVRPGDSLSAIAARYLTESTGEHPNIFQIVEEFKRLAQLNHLQDEGKIIPGDRIKF